MPDKEPMTPALESLALMLRETRKRRGLTLRQCAKETGVSSATLSRIERAKECDYTIGKTVEDWAVVHFLRAEAANRKRRTS